MEREAGDSFTFLPFGSGQKGIQSIGVWGYFGGCEGGGVVGSFGLFSSVCNSRCCTSFSLCLLSLAAADVNTNGWLQLLTRKDPWLCRLCIYDDQHAGSAAG